MYLHVVPTLSTMHILQGDAEECPVAGGQLGHDDNTKLFLSFCFTAV